MPAEWDKAVRCRKSASLHIQARGRRRLIKAYMPRHERIVQPPTEWAPSQVQWSRKPVRFLQHAPPPHRGVASEAAFTCRSVRRGTWKRRAMSPMSTCPRFSSQTRAAVIYSPIVSCRPHATCNQWQPSRQGAEQLSRVGASHISRAGSKGGQRPAGTCKGGTDSGWVLVATLHTLPHLNCTALVPTHPEAVKDVQGQERSKLDALVRLQRHSWVGGNKQVGACSGGNRSSTGGGGSSSAQRPTAPACHRKLQYNLAAVRRDNGVPLPEPAPASQPATHHGGKVSLHGAVGITTELAPASILEVDCSSGENSECFPLVCADIRRRRLAASASAWGAGNLHIASERRLAQLHPTLPSAVYIPPSHLPTQAHLPPCRCHPAALGP